MLISKEELQLKCFENIIEKYPEFKGLLEHVYHTKITEENMKTICFDIDNDKQLSKIYSKLINVSLTLDSMKQTVPIRDVPQLKEEIGMGAMGSAGVGAVFSSAGAEPKQYMGELNDCKIPKTLDVFKRFTSKF